MRSDCPKRIKLRILQSAVFAALVNDSLCTDDRGKVLSTRDSIVNNGPAASVPSSLKRIMLFRPDFVGHGLRQHEDEDGNRRDQADRYSILTPLTYVAIFLGS